MKESISFYGIKERKFTLKREDVIKACNRYIETEARPSTLPQGSITKVEWEVLLDENNQLDSLVCIEYYKLEDKNEVRNKEGG